jgi:hypothetical protein
LLREESDAGKIAGIVVESVVRGTRATLERKARRVMKKAMPMRFKKRKEKKGCSLRTAFDDEVDADLF